jgi:mitochondrial splicing suppressor protein 51
MHALALCENVSRAKTHVLHVVVESRPPTDHGHGRKAAKFFRVVEATVHTISEAMNLPPPWPDSLRHLERMREESERLGRGSVAVVGVTCSPMGVQMVPLGSLTKDMCRAKAVSGWKDVLMSDVEEGMKRTGFDHHNCNAGCHRIRRS